MQYVNNGGKGAPLPTRVNRACNRCRRNKSRCDAYRPCSLCLRANAACMTDDPAPKNAHSRNVSTSALDSWSGFADDSEHVTPLSKRKRRETQTSDGGVSTASAYTHTQSWFPHTSSPRSPRESIHNHDGESAITIARKIHFLDSQHIDQRAVDAIPGSDVGNLVRRASISLASSAPTSSYLVHPLPEDSIMVKLVEEYFESIHWFSLVILESKFRPAFHAARGGMATQSERPFLLLLSTILGLAAWYRAHVSHPKDGHPPEFWHDWSSKLLENSESQIIEIMNQNSVTAAQTLILLGSFYVYHGRPNLSFSLLGATVKVAQAAGLHREPVHGTQADREEKKRVWWTIYTWDRFASITYGRPLGINDEHCNIGQPGDVLESPIFAEISSNSEQEPICFSAYQRELNKLYMIASPAIENTYNVVQSEHPRVAVENLYRVREVTLRLWDWRSRLPNHLFPRLDNDCSRTLSPEAKAHRLQSLSLQLTFDSLIIVLHRPFIKQRLDLIFTTPSETSPASTRSQHGDAAQTDPEHSLPTRSTETSAASDITSHQQWWEAAIRTSRVTGLPQLAEFATDSHLVAFLAINLFNAAMVMVVVALSDPLTDKAQEAKRAVARIHRLEETLGARSTLSQQSSSVLRSLVQLLLRRESEAILAPMEQSYIPPSRHISPGFDQSDSNRISVRDALSMPFGHKVGRVEYPISSQTSASLGLASRLNDSLATVQKAFTIGSNVDQLLPAPLQSSAAVPGDSLHAESSHPFGVEGSDLHQSNADIPNSDWVGGNVIDDSGLYWFWDRTWDDLYTDVPVQQQR